MALLFGKDLTPFEIGGSLVLLASEHIRQCALAPERIPKISDLDQERFFDELFSLFLFAVGQAPLNFLPDGSLRRAILEGYEHQLNELFTDRTSSTWSLQRLNERFVVYRRAVQTLAFSKDRLDVGMEFARFCERQFNFSLFVYGEIQFANTIISASRVLKEAFPNEVLETGTSRASRPPEGASYRTQGSRIDGEPIPVRSIEEEYEIIENTPCSCGGKLHPGKQAQVLDAETRRNCDLVDAACSRCGRQKTFKFDIGAIDFSRRMKHDIG